MNCIDESSDATWVPDRFPFPSGAHKHAAGGMESLRREIDRLEALLKQKQRDAQGICRELASYINDVTLLKKSRIRLGKIAVEQSTRYLKAEEENVLLKSVIRKYKTGIDKIYNHNEAARVAVAQNFGVSHPITDFEVGGK